MSAQSEPSPANIEVLTCGELLEDGTLVDIVRLSSFGDEVGLLENKGPRVTIAPQLEVAGKLYRPQIAPSVRRAINLPTAPVEYVRTRDLFDRVSCFLRRFTGLIGADLQLASFFVFASWFPEFVPRRLTLLITTSFPAEAAPLLRSLRLLCRNALLLGDIDARNFCSMPLGLMPTLIMNQTRLSKRLMGLLQLANVPDLFIANAGDLVSPACFQVLCPTQADLDASLIHGTLHIVLAPRKGDAEILDEGGMMEAQTEVQPQLLAYRLRNYQAVLASTFDVQELNAPFRDMARSLGASIVDDVELQGQISSLIRPQVDEALTEEIATPEGAIAISVLAYVHAREKKFLPIYILSSAVNATLRTLGEIREYSPSEIGYRLLALGLYTARTSGGKVLRLDRATSRKIHALARRLGIALPEGGVPGCPDCDESSESKTVV